MIAVVLGAAAGVICVCATLRVLRASLVRVLTELCAESEAAHFWWRMVAIEVVGGTALCASLAVLLAPGADTWRAAAVVVQGSAAGLLVSLVVVMLAVMGFSRR